MAVEEAMWGKLRSENDKFPLGLRVLAVDDDMVSLNVLEKLLKECQYEVTTTNEAKVALEMLRENKNGFDIIITDVHMPDMDGLMLLELVGLEMDLPVIMLSVNDDPEMVMKGITRGACDYLVKPVRMEELKNIWQHVIRRKKREQEQPDPQDRDQRGNGESGNGTNSNGRPDRNGKRPSSRREDEEEDPEEWEEEDCPDNNEPGTQKKPRFVWSIELHNKFVAAINELDTKGAVPKKILEHMNVEGLKREHVASHLQKYRLYLKRRNLAALQAGQLSAGETVPYMPANSYDGVGDFSALASNQGRFSNFGMSSYQTGSMLNRLNAPYGGSLVGLSSPPPLPPNNHNQNLSNSFSTLGVFEHGNQWQTNKSASYTGNINLIGSSMNYPPGAQNITLPSSQNGGIFGNESSQSGPNNFNKGVFSNLMTNSSSLSEAFTRSPLVPNGNIENNSFFGGHTLNNPLNFSSTDVSKYVHDSRGEGSFPNSGLPSTLQGSGGGNMAMEPTTKPGGDYLTEQQRSQGVFGQIGYDVLDELLMNPTTKREQEGSFAMNGEFGINEHTI